MRRALVPGGVPAIGGRAEPSLAEFRPARVHQAVMSEQLGQERRQVSRPRRVVFGTALVEAPAEFVQLPVDPEQVAAPALEAT